MGLLRRPWGDVLNFASVLPTNGNLGSVGTGRIVAYSDIGQIRRYGEI